ncbi:MAG: DUF3450 family protein [Candidatus Sumerlaeia bacterium]
MNRLTTKLITSLWRRRFRWKSAILPAICLLMAPGLLYAEDPDEKQPTVAITREALEKYVEVQRVISEEKSNIKLSQEILRERIELVEQEIETLRGKIKDAEDNIAEADKKREEMVQENEKLKEATASLKEMVAGLEEGIKVMLPQLPEPLRERIEPLSQRLPKEDAKKKTTISQRFQNVVGILNEVEKFNRTITVTSQVRDLPDGSSAEVTSVFVGLGQGYYVGSNNSIAGIGRVVDSAWTWTPANDAAEKIANVIAILKNEQVADFVQLPAEIK